MHSSPRSILVPASHPSEAEEAQGGEVATLEVVEEAEVKMVQEDPPRETNTGVEYVTKQVMKTETVGIVTSHSVIIVESLVTYREIVIKKEISELTLPIRTSKGEISELKWENICSMQVRLIEARKARYGTSTVAAATT